jgi:hypothetical protein
VLVLAALLTTVGVAGATSKDQGRRLAGPFCIGKTTVSPLKVKNVFGQTVTVPRAGIVRSIGIGMKCNANENRRFGVPVKGGAGPAGESGPIGPQGPAGATGATGAKGDTGATGAQGPAGAQGAKGDTGEAGAEGAKGDTGADGAQGPAGAKGDKGDTGAAGAQGPAGAKGDKGDTGLTGAQGPAGAKGDKGDTGLTGAQGPAGAKGDKGDTGAAGAQGPAGPAGPTGPQGPAGANGLNGVITVAGGSASGDKQFTVSCPSAGDAKPGGGTYATDYFAISGGYNILGSVTASFRSDASGDPTGSTSWTVIQTSGKDLSGTVYVYCAPSS